MRSFISVEEAKSLIVSRLPRPVAEKLPLARAAGRFLAEDIIAGEDLPGFTNSARDGYAVREAELRGAGPERPIVLELAGEIRAGGDPGQPWPEGSCLRIMTGAPVPAAADGVIPVEETEELDGGRAVRFRADLALTGDNLRPAGEDRRAGEPLLLSGQRLGPAEIGLLAAQGVNELPVYRRPRVALLVTGDELVPHDRRPGPGQIRDSNGPLLATQLAARGVELRELGIASDERSRLRGMLAEALRDCDVLITSGGVSMGRYDLVGDVLAELGAEWVFHKIAQQPGKPLAFLVWKGKPVFGLPGNPVSGFVNVWYYVAPALGRMMGDPDPEPRHLRARLEGPLYGQPGKRFFARAWTEWREGRFIAEPRPPHGSHILGSLTRANSFILLPPDTGELEPGSEVEVALFD